MCFQYSYSFQLYSLYCTPNSDEISQSTAEFVLLPVFENGHYIAVLSVLIVTFSSSSAHHFASAYQISYKSVNARRSYYVISIFQHGGHRVKSISGFGFSDSTCSGMLKSTCALNFDEIYQLTAELILLPISEISTLVIVKVAQIVGKNSYIFVFKHTHSP